MTMQWTKLASAIAIGVLVGACTGQTSIDTNNKCTGDKVEIEGSCVRPDVGAPTDGGADGLSDSPDGRPTEDGSDGGGQTNDLPCEEWTDEDKDGVTCRYDNCPETPNPEQKDSDLDGVGDKCDNCPQTANKDQDPSVCEEPGLEDGEGGEGETCQEAAENRNYYLPDCDSDGDGIPDIEDLCPHHKPPSNASSHDDTDGDGIGDACDNCPETPNSVQADSDDDGTGDVCEVKPPGASNGGDVCQNNSKICGCKNQSAEAKTPDVYIVLDRSGSMDGTPWDEATAALDTLADELGNTLHFGIMTYADDTNEDLPMGDHTVGEIQQSYTGYNPTGGTDTHEALNEVADDDLYEDPNTNNEEIVVSITDGAPDRDQATVDAAGKLHDEDGVKVYAIGFKGGDPTNLNNVAEAGGTDAPHPDRRYYVAENPNQLVEAITDIAIQCEYDLSGATDVAPNKIWLQVNGSYLPEGEALRSVDSTDSSNGPGYVYDDNNQTITLTDDLCKSIQDEATSQDQISVDVVLGCPSTCQGSGEEVCDFKDNDCDGEIDEGNCGTCSKEICGNGEDDDCDGVVDEGCPDCQLAGQSCSEDGECCNNASCSDEGVCEPTCRPLGVSCTENSQCCGETCSGTGGNFGQCISG